MNKELRMKLRRKTICKALENIMPYITTDLFISVEDTEIISRKVYSKVDTIISQEEISKDIESNLNRVLSYKENFRTFFNKTAILLHYEDNEIGAIKIKVEDFFNHIYKIAEFTKFKYGKHDLVLIDEDIKYGICIERCEYVNKLIVWK